MLSESGRPGRGQAANIADIGEVGERRHEVLGHHRRLIKLRPRSNVALGEETISDWRSDATIIFMLFDRLVNFTLS